jgi:hypothetical protein
MATQAWEARGTGQLEVPDDWSLLPYDRSLVPHDWSPKTGQREVPHSTRANGTPLICVSRFRASTV